MSSCRCCATARHEQNGLLLLRTTLMLASDFCCNGLFTMDKYGNIHLEHRFLRICLFYRYDIIIGTYTMSIWYIYDYILPKNIYFCIIYFFFRKGGDPRPLHQNDAYMISVLFITDPCSWNTLFYFINKQGWMVACSVLVLKKVFCHPMNSSTAWSGQVKEDL